ncbi:MAG TPA: hypothetical protein VFG42_02360 [Baekduia sp.]|uniref:hypothetical protein n=1 Tax=Baekduia sp. TaxID=2600305 RepID=UPI002D79A1C8|nr:hypothetical protein [Baekduia sp.]HET6505609.1 hypothetical protein [Baekduia sp.]
MRPTQFYETTIYNRDRAGQSFSFVTIPARSFPDGQTPEIEQVASALGAFFMEDGPRAFRRNLRPWGLPFLIDGALGRRQSFRFYFDPDVPFGEKIGPSRFAEYLAFEAIIPFESSPLGAKALASLIGATTGTTGAALGYAATGEPLVLVTVPAGIVIAGVALGIGVGTATGLAEGIHHRITRLMGVPDLPQPPESAPGHDD